MRRIYYSFFIGQIVWQVFLQGLLFGMAVVSLAQRLHVAKIIENFLLVPVGQVPAYIMGAIFGAWIHGEVLLLTTLLVSGVIAVAMSVRLIQIILLPIFRVGMGVR
jgi:hypothetical protein